MKKKLLTKMMLLLCALVAGSSNVWADDYYVKVTQESDLTIGGTYIFIAKNAETYYTANGAYAKRLGVANSGFSVSADDSYVTVTTATPFTVVLGGEEDAYTLKMSSGNYLGKGSSNTEFAQNASTTSSISQYTWNFNNGTFYSNYYDTGDKGKDHRNRYIGFNYNSGTSYFGPYNTVANQPYAVLYKKVTATFTTADYAAFSCPAITSFNGIATVYKAKVNGGSVTLTAIADGIVPANQGVILYKDVDEKTTVSVPVAAAAGAGVFTDNELQVSNGTVTGDGSTIYALAQKSGVVGFYLVGDGVKVPAGKPYLVIDGSPTAPDFLGFSFGETTDVSEKVMVNSEKIATAPVYNLAGQRVAQPKKGLYIVNGKKVVIK